MVFERKVLRKIFGPTIENGVFSFFSPPIPPHVLSDFVVFPLPPGCG